MVGVGGFLHVMRGKEHRHSVALAAVVDYLPQRFARLRIKPGGRLVEYQYFGLMYKRASHVDTTALTAGKFA